VHFLPCPPHQSRLEAPRNVRDLHHQYLQTRSSLQEGEIGLVGGTLLSCMGRSSDAIVSPSAVGDVLISWSSSLGSCVWLSTSCPPCNMGLVLNDALPLVELAGSKLCLRSLGGSMCGPFTLCTSQSWRSCPSSPIP
jgi:hypothetical protein